MIESLKALRLASSVQNIPLPLFEFSDEDPRKAKTISLEQQKKQAKELLTLLQENDDTALSRAKHIFSGQLPEFTLSKAQFKCSSYSELE